MYVHFKERITNAVIGVFEIHKRITDLKFKGQRTGYRMMGQIMFQYWRIVREQILAGYLVELPQGFGTIAIYKVPTSNREYKTALCKKGKQVDYKKIDFKINYRYGYYYTILLASPYLLQKRYEFKAGKKLKEDLKNLLNNTFIEYRSIEEYDKQISEYKKFSAERFR